MSWDVLLVSVWTEPVRVSPSYQMIRDEISRRARILAKQRLSDFLGRHHDRFAEYGDVIRYQSHHPFCPGLLAIAAYLERAGLRVRCVSLDVERDRRGGEGWLRDAVAELAAGTRVAVGVTAVTPEYERALTVLEMMKAAGPWLRTMIGGAHVTYVDEPAAGHPAVDAVVRGEGEATALELVERWSEGRSIDDVRGVTLRVGGAVVRNPDRELIDLTTAPMPAYHLLDEEMRGRVHVTPTYSRGCPFSCNYCVESGFWRRRLRHKDARAFVDELVYIAEELNWRFIHIADSTFGIDRSATAALVDELERRRPDAVFSVNVRPEVFSYLGEALVQRLVAANFVEFYIGMESADDGMLETLERKQQLAVLRDALVRLRDLGVPFVKLYLIIGLPGDTHLRLQRTLNTVLELLEEGLVYYATGKYFVPTPGTVHDASTPRGAAEWSKFERYNFPPPVAHETLSPFELEQYLHLLQAMQLGHYRRVLGPDAGEDERIRAWTQRTYLARNYL